MKMDECIAVPIDRLIVLGEEDLDKGYGQLTHIKAFMYFPADETARERYLDRLRYEGTIFRITDTANCHEPLPPLTPEETRVLTESEKVHWNTNQERQIKLFGFVAAECLHFFLSALTYNSGGSRKTKKATTNNWLAFMNYRQEKDFWRKFPIAPIDKKTSKPMPSSPDYLASMRADFLSVAHLWAAYFKRDATERGLFDNKNLSEFVALAEAYRMKAVELNVYGHAVERTVARPYAVRWSDGRAAQPFDIGEQELGIERISDAMWRKIEDIRINKIDKA